MNKKTNLKGKGKFVFKKVEYKKLFITIFSMNVFNRRGNY